MRSPRAVQAEPGDPAALAGRLFRDMTGALELLTVYLGERLGLYQALHAGGSATSPELAARTGTVERYVRNGWNTMPRSRPGGPCHVYRRLRVRPRRAGPV